MHLGQSIIIPDRVVTPVPQRVLIGAIFEKVERFAEDDIPSPQRKTENAAGYDMACAEDTIIPSYFKLMDKLENFILNAYEGKIHSPLTIDEMAAFTKQTKCKPTLVPTGYKIYLPENYSLDLSVRSSSPLKYWIFLANSLGIIDADYADNPDNEGEIFFQLVNFSPFDLVIKKGEIIGQAKLVEFGLTDNDEDFEKEKRAGGLGSTTKNG